MKTIFSLILMLAPQILLAASFHFKSAGTVSYEKLEAKLCDPYYVCPFSLSGDELRPKIKRISSSKALYFLRLAGQAVYKMDLDINGHWVKCEIVDFFKERELLVRSCKKVTPAFFRPKETSLEVNELNILISSDELN